MKDVINMFKKEEEYLLIAPASYHIPIMLKLAEKEGFFDVKYISKEDFISANSIRLKETAVHILSKTLKLSPSVVEEMISYLPYLNEKTALEMDSIASLQDTIEELDLIEQTVPFRELYKNRTIYIYGYASLDPLFKKYMESLKGSFTFTIIEKNKQKEEIPFLFFHSEYEEVNYLCQKISTSLLDGVAYKNIKVHVANESYLPVIKTLFNRYHLSPYFSNATSLASFNITRKLLDMVKESTNKMEEDLTNIYEFLRKKLAYTSTESNTLFLKFVKVFNSYLLLDGKLSDYKDMIEYDLNKASIQKERTVTGIWIGDLSKEYISEDDHIFVLSCNEGDIPKITKNNGILDDSILRKIAAQTSTEKTSASKEEFLSFFWQNTINYVSYASHSLTSEKIMSTIAVTLLEEGRFIETNKESFSHHFSVTHDVISLAKMISDAKEYGQVSSDVSLYVNSIDIEKEYPPFFQQKEGLIRADLIPTLLEDLTSLSYSSVNDYFKCQFRFLLKKLLKVKESYSDPLPILIGDLFHKVLQQLSNLPTDEDKKELFFQTVLEELILEKELGLTKKELFYLRHTFTQLSSVTSFMKKLKERSDYSPLYLEKEYTLPLEGGYIKSFSGVIDVVMSLDDHFFIMDYKTGYASLDLSNIEYGLESQLIFYLYLFQEGEERKLQPSGFFYSPVFSKLMNAKDGKTYQDLLEEHYKLNGFVSEEHLRAIDQEYEDNSFIKGIKCKKNSTVLRKGAKVVSTRNQVRLSNYIKKLLEESVSNIEKGIFEINPKGTIEESDSCAYCEFKDICYKRSHNFVSKRTKEKNSLDFLLGGETDDTY